jgi:hypothetical protein
VEGIEESDGLVVTTVEISDDDGAAHDVSNPEKRGCRDPSVEAAIPRVPKH